MTHTVHIIENNNAQVYIMVNKKRHTLETLKHDAVYGDAHYQKKNAARSRFIRENHDTITIQYVKVDQELKTLKQVLDFRQQFIANYGFDNYVIVDDEYYATLDAPADTNFDRVLEAVNIKKLIQVWGKDVLMKARKTLTVKEFVQHFGSV